MLDVLCIDCGKRPSEIQEYIDASEEYGVTPESFVQQEEGTYNRENGHFLCTEDFIAREMATGRRLVGMNGHTWVAP